MSRKLLALCLFTIGCNRSLEHPKQVQIGSEFAPYVTSFLNEAQAQGTPIVLDDLIIVFTSEYNKTDVAGACYSGHGRFTPFIKVNEVFWQYANPTYREMMLFHELGHCILGRAHNDTTTIDLNQNIPRTIMSPYLFFSGTYLTHRIYYMYELFHGK